MRRSTPAAAKASTSASSATAPPTTTRERPVGLPAGLAQLVQGGQRKADRFRGVAEADPAVVGRRPAQRRRRLATDDQRWMGRLGRAGFEHDRVEVEETSVMLDGLLVHRPRRDGQGLVEPGPPAGEVEAGGHPFGLEPTGTDPDLEAAAGDDVHRLDGFRAETNGWRRARL